uniref:Pentraxin (PTX) domain-containing protein n=1 Tax=Denticeps clupeoides TaxID=299321 RepID=A0AAY4A571_9TELE
MGSLRTLALVWVCCSLEGREEVTVNYAESYYNEIPDDEPSDVTATTTPCASRDLSRWDRLFITLEDSQMRQNTLLQHMDDLVKVELQSLRDDMHRLCRRPENSCMGLSEQLGEHQDRHNTTLQQLLELHRHQAASLARLESGCVVGAGLMKAQMKSLPLALKEQDARSSTDGAKMERTLVALASGLQQFHDKLSAFELSAAERFLPSGCETALLFPMRSQHIFALVTPDASMALRALTICLWAKLTQSQNRTMLFSYRTTRNLQELQLSLARQSVQFVVHAGVHLVEARNAAEDGDGEWRHYCLTWSSNQGLASLWLDGQQVAIVPGVARGHTLHDKGTITLGQQGSPAGLDGDGDPTLAFNGKMTGVNMWDHVLGAEKVSQNSRREGSCNTRGNVIGWGVSEIVPHGGAQFIN